MNPVTRMSLIASLLVGLSVTANADVITDAAAYGRSLDRDSIIQSPGRLRQQKNSMCSTMRACSRSMRWQWLIPSSRLGPSSTGVERRDASNSGHWQYSV